MTDEETNLENLVKFLTVFDRVVSLLYAPIAQHKLIDHDSFDYNLGLAERALKEARLPPKYSGAMEDISNAIKAFKGIDLKQLKIAIYKPMQSEPARVDLGIPPSNDIEEIERMLLHAMKKDLGRKIYDEETKAYELARKFYDLDSILAINGEGGTLLWYISDPFSRAKNSNAVDKNSVRHKLTEMESKIAETLPILNLLDLEANVVGNPSLTKFAQAARHLLYSLDYRKNSPIYSATSAGEGTAPGK